MWNYHRKVDHMRALKKIMVLLHSTREDSETLWLLVDHFPAQCWTVLFFYCLDTNDVMVYVSYDNLRF